ncbi:hypothetical protein CU254_41935 (plasmid) [Amycolatopsis sp. AA4]|uniref:hypothetical protein n=1 Tax=Actinomycetes TaxID=1760 RepID=UPI0001B56C24|nr:MULTISPECIES: hypothetical protein [Actinomycetes]ATY17140.1 hypothetical protein CU254_41935 [Amycolatopsis sp. AA4]EFL12629.1 predicted protein [Streptomyces sp. AA4]
MRRDIGFAYLAYGYDLGGQKHGWRVQEADEKNRLAAEWYEADHGEDDDFLVQAEWRLLEKLAGLDVKGMWSVREPFIAQLYPDGLFIDEAMQEILGLAIIQYGSEAQPSYALTARSSCAIEQTPAVVEPAALAAEGADLERSDRRLADAMTALDLTPLQERPRWLLLACWG